MVSCYCPQSPKNNHKLLKLFLIVSIGIVVQLLSKIIEAETIALCLQFSRRSRCKTAVFLTAVIRPPRRSDRRAQTYVQVSCAAKNAYVPLYHNVMLSVKSRSRSHFLVFWARFYTKNRLRSNLYYS